jgi:Ca2+-binding EF-hand superfamily protein
MRNSTTIIAAIFLAVSIAAGANQINPNSAPSQLPPLTREAMADEFSQIFSDTDHDKNGFLDRQEWRKDETEEAKKISDTVFRQMDRNQDEKITEPELLAWGMRVFDCMDSDKSGQIETDEAKRSGKSCIVNAAAPAGQTDSKQSQM